MASLDLLFVVTTTTADRPVILRALANGGFEVPSDATDGRMSVRNGPSEFFVDISASAQGATGEATGTVKLEAAMGRAEPLLDLPPDRAGRSRLAFVLAGAVMALWEARIAISVASPVAGGRVESVEDFCRAVLAAPRNLPLVGPLVHYRVSRDWAEVRTEGAGLLGLPEVATSALPHGTEDGVQRAERALRALLLLWASPIEPADNGDLPRRYGVMELPSGVRWLTDQTLEPGPLADDAAHAKYQFFFRTYASAAFGGAVTAVEAWLAGEPRFHVARVACRGGLVAYLTNGLGAKPQASGSKERENDLVEICAIAPCEIPGLADVLGRIGSIVHAPGSRPALNPWDRCAVTCPPNVDIAGVVLRPISSLQIEPRRHVHVWDALPITHEELTRFRADPAAQGQWIDERFAREDYAEIHGRWRALGGAS